MNELVKSTAQISNKELKEYTTKIRNCGENIRKNYIKIAYLLNKVDTTECYLEDGFVNTQDYASHILGIQRTTCYNLLRIGKDYINEDGTGTILKCDGSDFGVSQIQALLPLGIEGSKTLVETGEITPEMSVRQIKKIVSDESENDVVGDVIDETEEIIPKLGSIDFLSDGTVITHGDLPESFIEYIVNYFAICYTDIVLK